MGLVGLVALAGSVFTAGVAGAATTSGNMTVTANIAPPPASCTVSAVGPVSSIDGGGGVDNGTGFVTVNCSQGTAYNVAMDRGGNFNGTDRRMVKGENFIPYSLSKPSGGQWGDNDVTPGGTFPGGSSVAGTGNGANQSLAVFPAILALPPSGSSGAFVDTVAVTVHF